MSDLPQVTEHQKDLASQALKEFEQKQFTSCCNIMNKLMAQRAVDPRVQHNKAVADFCLSGSQSTDEFRQSLANVCHLVSNCPWFSSIYCKALSFGGDGLLWPGSSEHQLKIIRFLTAVGLSLTVGWFLSANSGFCPPSLND